MATYHIWIIYEDGTIYTSTIRRSQDFSKIPRNKAYEAIRIYYDDKKYSHVIYGNDFVYLDYNSTSGQIVKAQWDIGQTTTTVITLAGYNNQETIQNNIAISSLTATNKIFTGKLLADSVYEDYRSQCDRWMPSS